MKEKERKTEGDQAQNTLRKQQSVQNCSISECTDMQSVEHFTFFPCVCVCVCILVQ